jgi:hypothetical protein
LITELPETLDNDMKGLVGILPGGVIGDADGIVVGLRDARLVHRKINNEVHIVATGVGCRQRSKDANRAHFTGQRIE